MYEKIADIARSIGDLFAIPFFALLVIYFYKKPHKTFIELLLYLFGIFGLLFDIVFTAFALNSYFK